MQTIRTIKIDPSNISFDVYQHLPSGATFVLPSGAELKQAANGESRPGAHRKTHHQHQQGFKREAADLTSQPSAQREEAADGGGRLGAYRKTQHEHEQSFKREAGDLAAKPSAQ